MERSVVLPLRNRVDRRPRFGLSGVSLLITLLVSVGPSLSGWALPLSAGDRIRIVTPSDNALPAESGLRLSGLYEVSPDGMLKLPLLKAYPVAGLEATEVERALADALVNQGFFRSEFLRLSVQVEQWAPIQVTVTGGVFSPGRVLLRSLGAMASGAAANGPFDRVGLPDRDVTTAIRSAGGLMPTADIQRIRLIRNRHERVIDLSGVLSGQPVPEVPLIAGDRLIIANPKQPQPNLIRPSQLTPSEIPVLVSNQLTLSMPTTGQALMLPYGTRLSQAIVAAGCTGGTAANQERRAVLLRTDRQTGKTQTIEHPINKLLDSSSSDANNPFLMPHDSIVCYDATVTGVQAIRLLDRGFAPTVPPKVAPE